MKSILGNPEYHGLKEYWIMNGVAQRLIEKYLEITLIFLKVQSILIHIDTTFIIQSFYFTE